MTYYNPNQIIRNKTVRPSNEEDKNLFLKTTYSEQAADVLGLTNADYLLNRVKRPDNNHKGKKPPPKIKPVACLIIEKVEKMPDGIFQFEVNICSARESATLTAAFKIMVDFNSPHRIYEQTIKFEGIKSEEMNLDFKRLAFMVGEDMYERIKKYYKTQHADLNTKV